MTIDPRYSFWLSVALAILGSLVGAGAEFTDLGLSPTVVKAVLALVALLLGIGNSLNAILTAIPSKSDPTSLNKFYLGPKVPATQIEGGKNG